jgi:hypothetical protein
MSRFLACFTVLVLVSGGSLAVSSTNVPPRAVLQSGLPALSEGLPALLAEWSAMTPGQPFAKDSVTDVIQVAGRFNKGARRNAGRGGGIHHNANRNVNRNVNVNARRGGVVVVDDHDDHDNKAGAAIVGGLIGVGVGAAIANSNQPNNSCSGSNCGY